MSGTANNPYKQEAPDKTLTQEGVAADAKAVGNALAAKADNANVPHCLNVNATPYMIFFGNTGNDAKTVDIGFSNSDQYVLIILSGPNNTNVVSMIGCDSFEHMQLGYALSVSKDSYTAHVTLPAWSRGFMISYNRFTVNNL